MHISIIVYAYGDQFVEGRRRGGIQLPCRDVRVKKRELANTAMTAAFVSLAEGGQLRLILGQRRVLLGLRKRPAVFVQPLDAAADSYGLEAQLLQALSDDQESNSIMKVVERVLPISGDPWGDIIMRIEEGMLEQGYFVEGERKKVAKFLLGKKLEPDCPRIATLEDQVEPAKRVLTGFQDAHSGVYDQLLKDVQKGIRARLEVEMDDDFD